ncbi:MULTISPECIES: malto-oligosyltrehalose trehalohydrolase [unclassified Bradyrhizobium]|uniref:malto-oligosyltrehalose trehalohydrolase n=1 Tax=unclassified Bradyrhizobium TaxID=2631580 RepID=UPI001BA62245|nr:MULTISPECIES: malto-oligosyltrehalose trehalohydrolase [unclassified Bradyrhizobium]MBR1201611.1 malto-oligosyltrehalose trehalohydrolase [Bradyrhizobium sp. AUGA SZCCT0124]MBR1310767.1 malto-oligosyltrehalose trehalohydrolase [Bradyrhizobium sp. AUGA SZCCT0051]MBR1340910.1 malto-oligosyltrehalose trehalohydrolase [Bradyrhizobium sp. AUGA SZCCT0105]MBR1355516.1 malto-oligosyltrehalose trehalohydrolase [Bradyrhizobium sp. AUGA SZCCT0045]
MSSARHFGPELTADGARFRLWAPAAKRVDLLLDKPHALARDVAGWYVAEIAGARAGTRYKFRIDDDVDVPDPASAFQPDDVFGPSEVIDHSAFKWRATGWRSRPWHEAVILEAHVGTFTPEGTYRAMIDKLDHLVATGITALELMPLADFAGKRNWGYDGVLWYAPDSAYGRPEDLKTLIDEAHLRGLMVMLDVVYNHFGPEGNYLGRYAPSFFSDAHTPWGSAIDYRVPEVRAFTIGSVVSWLRDYRFDGLRFDAVNTIVEAGEISILHDFSKAAGKLATETGRHINLVLENGDNIASLLDAAEDPPHGKFRGQWNDDYHHAWHVLLTGETQGYYGDYRAPKQDLARALSSGYIYQGEVSAFWGGKARGEPSGALSPTCFINFLQNHDQIGNRPLGDRLESIAKPEAIEAALAVTLIAPTTPMLFMGEEWGATTPFPFFCDFKGGLANAVRAGRRKEFAWAYAKYGDDIPDPLAEATVRSAVLDWAALGHDPARARLALVRDLLAVRRREITPRLIGVRFGGDRVTGDLLTAHWRMGDGRTLWLTANLSDRDITGAAEPKGTAIWGGALSSDLPGWAVRWHIG